MEEMETSDNFLSFLESMRSVREEKSDDLNHILSAFTDAEQKHKVAQQFNAAEIKLEQIRKTRQQTNQHLNAKLYQNDAIDNNAQTRQPFIDAHEYQRRINILDDFASVMHMDSSDGSALKRPTLTHRPTLKSLSSNEPKMRTVRFDLESTQSPKLYHSNSLLSMQSNVSHIIDESSPNSHSNSAFSALNASHRNLSDRNFGLESFAATTQKQMQLHRQNSQATVYREQNLKKSYFNLWRRYVEMEKQLCDDLEYQTSIKRAFKEWKRRHIQIYEYQRRIVIRRWKVALNKEKEFVNEIARYPARSRRTYLLMVTSLRWMKQKLPMDQFERFSDAWHNRYAKIILVVLFATWRKPVQDRHIAANKVFKVLRETNREFMISQLQQWRMDAKQSRVTRRKRFLALQESHKNNVIQQTFGQWYRLFVARNQIRMALFQWANKSQFRIFEQWKRYTKERKRKRRIIDSKKRMRILRQSFDWWVSAYIRIKEEYNPPHTQLFLPNHFPPTEQMRMQSVSRLHQCQLIGTVIRFHR